MAASAQQRTSRPAAVDIGGTLVKLVYWRPPNPPRLPAYIVQETSASFRSAGNFELAPDKSLSVSMAPGAVLKFIKFPTTHAETFIQFVKATRLHEMYGLGRTDRFHATGGGAYKFAQRVADELSLELVQHDEMVCLVRGLNFLLRHCDAELFSLELATHSAAAAVDLSAAPVRRYASLPAPRQPPFPYMVVNVGSGVSVLRVFGDEQFERVSGSGIGGGTFWGLTRLLTSFRSFDEVLACCRPGAADNANVDILVRDIYGAGANPLGLDPSVTASYFGKVQRNAQAQYRDADIMKSLVYMVSDNVAQIGFLLAQIHNITTLIFCGGFVCSNPCVWQGITKAVHYWTKGSMQVRSACRIFRVFLRKKKSIFTCTHIHTKN